MCCLVYWFYIVEFIFGGWLWFNNSFIRFVFKIWFVVFNVLFDKFKGFVCYVCDVVYMVI